MHIYHPNKFIPNIYGIQFTVECRRYFAHRAPMAERLSFSKLDLMTCPFCINKLTQEGSTTLKLVDHITNTNATYVTNGITHARMLIHKGMQTYIVGGKIKPLTEAVVGAEAIKSIKLL